uniref:Uncharacterized protein n=1 Tax=Panagrolaimus superbus TaxID=310955 RepID=A0A914Y797_9BILA
MDFFIPPNISQHQAYLNFWNSLNNCLDDEDKILPMNGIEPTVEEAKNLWNSMKEPRRRKLLWISTGFIHEDFPDDKEQFIKEEMDGIIYETNVGNRHSSDNSSSSDDEEEEEMSILLAENVSPSLEGVQNQALQNLSVNQMAENCNNECNLQTFNGKESSVEKAVIEIIELSSDED